jgi:hypothetical protein
MVGLPGRSQIPILSSRSGFCGDDTTQTIAAIRRIDLHSNHLRSIFLALRSGYSLFLSEKFKLSGRIRVLFLRPYESMMSMPENRTLILHFRSRRTKVDGSRSGEANTKVTLPPRPWLT